MSIEIEDGMGCAAIAVSADTSVAGIVAEMKRFAVGVVSDDDLIVVPPPR